VRRANEKLTEANELLESENTLIEYENKQKEEHAYLESRHHIYHEIAEQMYPYQKRIRELLEKMQPGAEAFREQLAYVSVLNAFVKRKTNFLLLSSEKDRISCHELFLAISESGRYLSYVGLRASVDENGFREAEDADFPAGIIISLYDSFEEVVEQLIGHAGLLMVSFSAEGLKLATDADSLPQKGKGGLPIQSRRSDDILYLSSNPSDVQGIVDKYQIEYIIVGDLERHKYGYDNSPVFAQLGNVIFQYEDLMVYKVTPSVAAT